MLLEALPSFAANRKRNLTCVASRSTEEWEKEGGENSERNGREREGEREFFSLRPYLARTLSREPGYYRVKISKQLPVVHNLRASSSGGRLNDAIPC